MARPLLAVRHSDTGLLRTHALPPQTFLQPISFALDAAEDHQTGESVDDRAADRQGQQMAGTEKAASFRGELRLYCWTSCWGSS
jgi:hypothetical protein